MDAVALSLAKSGIGIGVSLACAAAAGLAVTALERIGRPDPQPRSNTSSSDSEDEEDDTGSLPPRDLQSWSNTSSSNSKNKEDATEILFFRVPQRRYLAPWDLDDDIGSLHARVHRCRYLASWDSDDDIGSLHARDLQSRSDTSCSDSEDEEDDSGDLQSRSNTSSSDSEDEEDEEDKEDKEDDTESVDPRRYLLQLPLVRRVVVCYVGSWARYRPGRGAFTIDDIDPSLCTHLIYAFAGLDIDNNSICSLDKYNDLEEENGKGSYKKITSLKKRFPHLKVTLAIGGWTQDSANYSLMASSGYRRQKFITSVVAMLETYNFDGLDLDWEYPGMRGGKPGDKENFVQLVRELREEFDRHKHKHNWILTAALGAPKNTIDTAYDVRALSRYLDFMHIMCYDYHGTWDKRTGPNAPLYGSNPQDTFSVDFTIKYYLRLGAPRHKLVMGLPTYGRTFISDGPSNARSLDVPAAEKGFQGPFTKEDGFMGYNEICSLLTDRTSRFQKYWDEKSKTPYAIQGNKIIVYDDPRSLTLKVRCALQYGLAGVMVWSIETDDFHGDYSEENYPLLRAINRALAN